jgi:hypothetical protein
MFRILTEADLLSAFRPRDRKHVELPKDFRFPHFVRDYLAWCDPTLTRTFLVLVEPRSQRPMGITFRRDQKGDNPVGHMCDWCHTSGSCTEIGLITAEASSKRVVGVNACLDLRCGEKIETAANLAGKNGRELQNRLMERMVRFAREGLKIDFVPAA